MGLRMLVSLTAGRLAAKAWLEAALEEAPVAGKPRGCGKCPLRPGGEWEAGAAKALSDMNSSERDLMSDRWGCHNAPRPCAGMRRLDATVAVR